VYCQQQRELWLALLSACTLLLYAVSVPSYSWSTVSCKGVNSSSSSSQIATAVVVAVRAAAAAAAAAAQCLCTAYKYSAVSVVMHVCSNCSS
jgi:hypothetical protein